MMKLPFVACMSKKILLLLSLILFIGSQPILAQLGLTPVATSVESSFRGLSVVDDNVAWVSGSKGTVGITVDGGSTWRFTIVPEHDASDFRSIYAFDERKAVIANVGSPGHILVTNDSGKSWQVVYTNSHEAAFIDGVDFWDKSNGLMYGDPIDGKMLVIMTSDGGSTWQELPGPVLAEGEASFAASGTGIRCYAKDKVMISTGGLTSRLWNGQPARGVWSAIEVPVVQGQPATGIYSFAIKSRLLVAVGGDYTKPEASEKQSLLSTDFGKRWADSNTPTRGYRECVEWIDNNRLLDVGPTGMDVSNDRGINWQPLNDEKGYHVVRKARKGSLIVAAGAKGQIAIIK
ncbi:MAG: photosystem II stability/assembly factor-like protein [Cyclobacteriaceae bacterium]|nr:photosystem II stability/assembly factor-like protein [Cyclobacteriaceae bacterium]